MDCCDFISSIDTSVALLVGVSFVILYAYFANLFKQTRIYNLKKAFPLSEEIDNVKGIVCQSVNCVRCNHNAVIQQNARDRFILYYKTNTNKELDRLKNSNLLNDKETLIDQNRYVLYLPGLSSVIWFDSKLAYKCDIEKLENNYSEILKEFYEVNYQDGWIVNEKQEGCWRVFHLVSQGKIIPENASRCPKTMNIITDMHHIMSRSIFSYVTFSVMEPGTVIKPHYGSTNCRMRCHLGLQVDPGSCYLEVAGQRKSWEVGKCLIFDDSFLHSAYHNGTKESNFRAVLMMDMWHPELSKDEIDCISTVYTTDLMSELVTMH